jgi:hypothetical protein
MKSADMTVLSNKYITELLQASNQCLEFSGYVNRFQIEEIRFTTAAVFRSIELALCGNVSELKQLQFDAFTRSIAHLLGYQKYSRNSAIELQQKLSSNSQEYLQKSIDMLSDFVEESDKKIPIGSKRMADTIREVAYSGSKASRISQNLVNIAIENVDQVIDRYIAVEDPAIKG